MSENKFSKNTATHNPEKQHKTAAPQVHPHAGNTHQAELPHEEQGHPKQEKSQKKREAAMKTKIASILSTLALAMLLAFGFASKVSAKSAGFKFNFASNNFKSSTFKTPTLQNAKLGTAKFDAFDCKAFNLEAKQFKAAAFKGSTPNAVDIKATNFKVGTPEKSAWEFAVFDKADFKV